MDTIDTLNPGCYDSAMSNPDLEQLEEGVSILLEAYRKLKGENQKLAAQVDNLIREGQGLAKEKEFIKQKLERLAELEAANRNNENDRKQIREKVALLLEKIEKFDLT